MSSWGNRVCAACHQDLSIDDYSTNQWSKGLGVSRCRLCVSEGIQTYNELTLRSNNSNHASVTRAIFAEGAFRYVSKGRYTSGQRKGQECVAKWFKTGLTFEASYFKTELEVVNKAAHILTQWNGGGFITQKIRINQPAVWTFSDGPDVGKKLLVEPFIQNFTKFNSNTGWVSADGGSWNDVFQALSHFSYHVSSGQFLLCDLQGGLYRDGAIITDPVIQSQDRRCGPTDLGKMGISTFFSRHRCNRFCRSSWTMPHDRTPYYRAVSSTSMMDQPGRGGAPPPPPLRSSMPPPPPRLAPVYDDSSDDSDDYYF